jgi:hypothetical protein
MNSVATHMTPNSAISGAPDIDLDSRDVFFAGAKREWNLRFYPKRRADYEKPRKLNGRHDCWFRGPNTIARWAYLLRQPNN